MLQNCRKSYEFLETVSLTWSSVSSSCSSQPATMAVKAQVFLTWINLLVVAIINATMAVLLHFRKANNRNLKIWRLAEVTEILGSPAWNSKCQIPWCCSVFQMGLNSSWWLHWAVLVRTCPSLPPTETLVHAVNEFKGGVSPAPDLVTQFYRYVLPYKNWVVFLYFRKIGKILPETMLLISSDSKSMKGHVKISTS